LRLAEMTVLCFRPPKKSPISLSAARV
jgi:hypothetical protein